MGSINNSVLCTFEIRRLLRKKFDNTLIKKYIIMTKIGDRVKVGDLLIRNNIWNEFNEIRVHDSWSEDYHIYSIIDEYK